MSSDDSAPSSDGVSKAPGASHPGLDDRGSFTELSWVFRLLGEYLSDLRQRSQPKRFLFFLFFMLASLSTIMHECTQKPALEKVLLLVVVVWLLSRLFSFILQLFFKKKLFSVHSYRCVCAGRVMQMFLEMF